jgi:hypothetical protein
MAKHAGNCPSTVAGSTTAIKTATPEGQIVIEIKAADEAAVATIRSRTKHLIEVQAAPDAKIEHTGKGTGGGAIGLCPVVTVDTEVTSEDIEGGVQVTMTPKTPEVGKTLNKDVEDRIAKAKEWTDANVKEGDDPHGTIGGSGGGTGKHGGNRSGHGDGKGAEPAADKPDDGKTE